MMKIASCLLQFAILVVFFFGIGARKAEAAQNCITTGVAGGPAVTRCTEIVHPPFNLEQRYINSGLQRRDRLTFNEIDKIERTDNWLWNRRVGSWKKGLRPTLQDATRIERLKTPPQ